jgi:hypothetical protein
MIKTKKLTKPPKSSPKTATAHDFHTTFHHLKKILQRHVGTLFVKKDEPNQYYLETASHSWKGQRMFFGAVIIKKNYVSFHLMPLYISPELLQTISPELKLRMQGKACFNFTNPDASLFAQLAKLTEAGHQKYKAKKLL